MKKLQTLLPWYINKTLTSKETHEFEAWLQNDVDARASLASVQQIASAVNELEIVTPSIRVRNQIISNIQQPIQKQSRFLQWVWGVTLTGVLFAFLWLIIQPGHQLEWSVSATEVAVFRIYRAPANKMDFELIEEIPAVPFQNVYQFVDPVVLPGQGYHYKIEVVDQFSNSTISELSTNNSFMVFAAQFAILLTSFTLTFGIITIVGEIRVPKMSLMTF